MIKLVEGLSARNKNLKGLALTISFQEGESVQTEFYRVKDALLDWKSSRGEAGGALELEYQADESCWPQIEQFWVAKFTNDRLIQSLLGSLESVNLRLVTPTGNSIKSVGFESGRSQGPS